MTDESKALFLFAGEISSSTPTPTHSSYKQHRTATVIFVQQLSVAELKLLQF